MTSSLSPELETWVRDQYHQRYCDKNGRQIKLSNGLQRELSKLRPNEAKMIGVIIKKINQELYEMTPQQFGRLLKWVRDQCCQFPSDETGGFQDKAAVIEKLVNMRPDCHPSRISQMVNEAQKKRIKAFEGCQTKQAETTLSTQTLAASAAGTAQAPSANSDLEAWVSDQFLTVGFNNQGAFVGYRKLKKELRKLRPDQKGDVTLIIQKLRQPGHEFSFPDPESISAQRKSQPVRNGVTLMNLDETMGLDEGIILDPETIFTRSMLGTTSETTFPPALPSNASASSLVSEDILSTASMEQTIQSALLGGKYSTVLSCCKQPKVFTQTKPGIISSKISALKASIQARRNSDNDALPKHSQASGKLKASPRLSYQLSLLLATNSSVDKGCHEREGANHDIRNAVLVSADTVEEAEEELLPQYGLLGSFSCERIEPLKNLGEQKVLLNTNIPFSAFICGVQGSGKSYTTACLLENCVIRSPMLGNLESPLSALVFHFSEFTSRTTYNPSEAAFLAVAHRNFPDHPTASSVTVLVPASNYYSLNQLYTQIPKVKVRLFKLQPQMLDVGTMLTLMAFDQSQNTPLYMAQVTKILRDIATESASGFSYLDFKTRLVKQKFDRVQTDFLNQRLDLLESFLDLDGSCTDPLFESGEITIMDMSCPFVDSNTACVLFKIAMRKYLESSSDGKMIILDEAHKYMIDAPAAKDLNESLLTVIRQQRHFGVRVIISTQEPTISPQLIDLCAITVIHRFTSPDWFNTLKRHISISSNSSDTESYDKGLFRKILNLYTGEALVFAPTAVLGKDDTGKWVKATEELLKVSVRKRVTWDGGHSVVCV